jgi:hypothetical protein
MQNQLKQCSDVRFQSMIGTKIQFVDKRGRTLAGTLDFAGINHKLHGKFQVTVNRTPYWPVDPKTIKQL